MMLPVWGRRVPGENDDEVPEGASGCRCTLPGVPSAFCPAHGEGLVPLAERSLMMPFAERFVHWQQQPDEELVDYHPVDAAEVPARVAAPRALGVRDGEATVLFYGADGGPFAQYTYLTSAEAHRAAWQYVAGGGPRHVVRTLREDAETHYVHPLGEREAVVRGGTRP
jgi:hypothetical protein